MIYQSIMIVFKQPVIRALDISILSFFHDVIKLKYTMFYCLVLVPYFYSFTCSCSGPVSAVGRVSNLACMNLQV